jgi:putative SOS response-associated peptidase YedK
MCGRFSITKPIEAIRQLFNVPQLPNLEARFNLAPSQPAPVVRLDREGNRELAMLRWGLIPWWAKDPAIGYKTINARVETVATKPASRDAFQRRRCLVPTDGFYEWQKVGKEKQPFRITMADEGLFGFAGLWERWKPPEGEPVESFTIVVGEPNELVRPIHDRMPVIIDPVDYETWLDADPSEVGSLLRPYPAEKMRAYPVSRRANSPDNDDAEIIAPVSSEPAQGSLLL